MNAQSPENLKTTIAEIILKNKNIEHANYYNNLLNEYEYFKFKGQKYTNHLVNFKKEVLSVLPGLDREASTNRLRFPRKEIDRCFKYDTVEEIFSALDKEETEWAHKTLSTLKRKSPLSLKLTLKLLRNGRNLSLKECFEQEFRVSFRRMHDKEYQESIKARLIDKKRAFNQWEHKALDSITKDQVDRYFAPLNKDFELPDFSSGLKLNSLHPARYFYQEYPEIIRSWVNQESLKDEALRIDYLKEVRDYLRQLGIDHRNVTLEPSNVRNLFFNLDRMKRKITVSAERIKEISEDRVTIEKYQKERLELIDKFFQDEKQIQSYIDDSVERIFVKLFKERQQKAFNLSRTAHHYHRKTTFARIKDIITKSRLIKPAENVAQQTEKEAYELSKNIGIPVFFPDDYNKSYLDVPNPDIVPKHPYTKYRDQMELKNTLSHEYYEEYLSGKVPSLATTDINYPENLSKEKVLDLFSAGRFLDNQVEEDPKTQKENLDYILVWGLPEELSDYDNSRIKAIQDQLLEIDQEFARLAESDPKIKDRVLNYDPSKDQASLQIEASADTVFSSRKLQIELAEKTYENNKVFKTVKSLDSLLQTQSLIDLEFKKNAKLQTLTFDPKTDNTEDYWQQLLNSILDNQVLDCLHRLFSRSALESQVAEVQKLSSKLKTALTQIYKNKSSQILKEERLKYNSIRPLFTKDNIEVLNQNNFGTKDQQFMAEIDDYITKNVNFEFNNFVSSHVFYTFAYLGLAELEDIYNKLSQIKTLVANNINDKTEEKERLLGRVTELLRAKGISVSGENELEELLKYCGIATKSLSRLHNLYHDKVHFQEDRILQAFHILRTQFEDSLFGRRRRKNFIGEAVEQEEEQMGRENISRRMMDLPFADENIHKAMLRKGLHALSLSKNQKIFDDDRTTLLYYLAYAQGLYPSNQGDHFVPGIARSLEMLDIITKRAIYGVDNPIPQHLLEASQNSEIPDCLPEFDLRESPQKWIERKVNQNLPFTSPL